ncbi:MAG: hypothetical protein ACOCM4_08780, partial [Acetivibrio ethanolgignens]
KIRMKILLTAINAKYIHSNLAIYELSAYAEKYKENIELAEYTINESDGTYYLESSFELPESVRENSVQAYRGHWIVNSAEDCSVSEYDEKGKAILTFKYHISNYTPKVYKKDMKGFWFQ